MTLHHSLLLCFITLLFPAFIKQTAVLMSVKMPGILTAEPGSPFLQGSDLTIYCHLPNCLPGSRFILEVKDVKVELATYKCTTTFHLSKVTTPKTLVLCKLKEAEGRSRLVAYLELESGVPPEEPKNISCVTTRVSDFIDCSWDRGRETHVATTYNVSLFRRGTLLYRNRTDSATHVKLPRAILASETLNQLQISAYNHFGMAHSELSNLCLNAACPVHLVVVPESPQIKLETFENDTLAAIIEWTTHDGSQNLSLEVSLSRAGGFWEVKEHTRVGGDLIRVDGLEPLSEYKFQMRICDSTSRERALRCSKWSDPVVGTTPGRGPSKALQTWRTVGDPMRNGLRRVTVMWKALPAGEFSGRLDRYKIDFKDAQTQKEEMCPAALSQCEVLVPPHVSALDVSAVTTYGTSPPSLVPLVQSSVPGPVITDLAPSANGSSVPISWSYRTNHSDDLNFVMEWTSVPSTGVQWKTAAVDQHSSIITGLTAGVRFNVSLYVVARTVVSAPSSRVFYSKELKPGLGPSLSVLLHERRQVVIRWAELAVDQQRGFLTHYTIYVQTLHSQDTQRAVSVSASGPKQKELECPEGPVSIWMTASNSAGEGPRGGLVTSHPKPPADGPMMVLAIIVGLFIATVANLLCWSCLRKRMKEKCMSWELRNSKAIRLLEDKADPLFPPTHDDPPLSPVTPVHEGSETYPTIQVDQSRINSEEQPLNTAAAEKTDVDQPEHVGYKPQHSTLARRADGGETEADVMASIDDGGRSRGLDFNFQGCIDPNAFQGFTTEFQGGVLTGETGSSFLHCPLRNIDVESVIVDLQPEENVFPVIHLPQDAVERLQTVGYFHQMPIVNVNDNSDTKK
ncbi:interleukin-23 receptor isoform X2 [Synchiropus splendidus]|uniref:interleukin-23 receptor isoform X2 n=1 Tax=Synchiropus splendidus TaxID=270530 RepID=UPI00237E53DA|nr:interleukin-23 receptor isoform X2 [Synchiropus splendidus]